MPAETGMASAERVAINQEVSSALAAPKEPAEPGEQGEAKRESSAAVSSEGRPAKRQRTVRFAGRDANPRRLHLWQNRSGNKVLFDVVLKAKDRDVPSNRLLLAEESEFFEGRFSNPEFAGPDDEVSLPEIDGDTLETVVSSLLTAQIALHEGNLERVLHCADLLQLGVVKAACCQYVEETLSEDSVPRALDLAERYHQKGLRAAVLEFTHRNFFLMHRTALRTLSEAALLEVLSDDDLVVFSEMQVFRAILAWCEEHSAPVRFPALFGALRLAHLQSFEMRSLLQEELVTDAPRNAITEAALARLEGYPLSPNLKKRDGRRYVWAINAWSQQRLLPAIRSAHFHLDGSERTWVLSRTADTDGLHLTCLGSEEEEGEEEDHIPYSPMSQEAAREEVQLTLVLYDQRDYNNTRRWRLPRCTLSPGEYQGFEGFFKDVAPYVLHDRVVVGVQLRLVSRPTESGDNHNHLFYL